MDFKAQIANLKAHVDREAAALRREIAHSLRAVEDLLTKPLLPVRQWTGIAANITITSGEVNMRHVVTNTAAHDFTLPVMDIRAVVEVMNNSTSTNNISVRDSGGTLIDTLTPGSPAVPYKLNNSGTVVPS